MSPQQSDHACSQVLATFNTTSVARELGLLHDQPTKGHGLSWGAKIGIGVGSAIGGILLIIISIFLVLFIGEMVWLLFHTVNLANMCRPSRSVINWFSNGLQGLQGVVEPPAAKVI